MSEIRNYHDVREARWGGGGTVDTLKCALFSRASDGSQAFLFNGVLFGLFAFFFSRCTKTRRSIFIVVIYVAHKGWLKGKVTPEFLHNLFDCAEPRGTNRPTHSQQQS